MVTDRISEYMGIRPAFKFSVPDALEYIARPIKADNKTYPPKDEAVPENTKYINAVNMHAL